MKGIETPIRIYCGDLLCYQGIEHRYLAQEVEPSVGRSADDLLE
jgi:hypothetical protein